MHRHLKVVCWGAKKRQRKRSSLPPFSVLRFAYWHPFSFLFLVSAPPLPPPPPSCPREALPGRGRSLSLVHTQAHAVDFLRLRCGRRSAKRSGASSPHSDASSPFVAELALRDAVDRNSSLQHAANAPPLALVSVLDKPIRKPSSDTGMAWAWQATIGIFPRGSCQGN